MAVTRVARATKVVMEARVVMVMARKTATMAARVAMVIKVIMAPHKEEVKADKAATVHLTRALMAHNQIIILGRVIMDLRRADIIMATREVWKATVPEARTRIMELQEVACKAAIKTVKATRRVATFMAALKEALVCKAALHRVTLAALGVTMAMAATMEITVAA